jgi:peroxiredoxin
MNLSPFKGGILALAAVMALVIGVYFGIATRTEAPSSNAAGLLALALPDADGHEQRLDQWKGRVIVVNFWATWCVPCREEMPRFVKAQQEFGPRGLQFVGIAVDQPDKIRQFASELALNYPSLVGGYGALELSKTLGNKVMALPFTIILDRKGRVAYTQLGVVQTEKLDGILGQLL